MDSTRGIKSYDTRKYTIRRDNIGMVWRVLDHTIDMARGVSGRDDMRITLCRESDTTHFLREYIMNLFYLNSDKIIYNIDGKDIEMKHPICFGKVYDKWLVSRCGKVWSISRKRFISGTKSYVPTKKGKRLTDVKMKITTPIGFWEDGSGRPRQRNPGDKVEERNIRYHKVVIDTWKPLYDNPPEGIVWEEWKIVRDLPSVYNHITKTITIDHIDDDPTNNHLDNLRRVTSWDNNYSRKAKGI